MGGGGGGGQLGKLRTHTYSAEGGGGVDCRDFLKSMGSPKLCTPCTHTSPSPVGLTDFVQVRPVHTAKELGQGLRDGGTVGTELPDQLLLSLVQLE